MAPICNIETHNGSNCNHNNNKFIETYCSPRVVSHQNIQNLAINKGIYHTLCTKEIAINTDFKYYLKYQQKISVLKKHIFLLPRLIRKHCGQTPW